MLGKIEDLSIDELDNVDIDLHDNVDITRLNYRGEMKRQFQTLDKPQQQLIHRIFDLTKKDMSRTNHKIQGNVSRSLSEKYIIQTLDSRGVFSFSPVFLLIWYPSGIDEI